MVQFIPFTADYLERVAELEQCCFPTPWTREMFAEELKSNLTHYLLAVDGQAVIGYAGLWKVLDEGQITNVAVHPDYRRKHIAQSLLNALIQQTKVLGIVCYTLEVREGNFAAQNLYQKLGFRQVGYRKGYYADTKEAAILMTLELEK